MENHSTIKSQVIALDLETVRAVGRKGAWAAVGYVIIALACWCLYVVIYNLYFHPLRNFPGPFWHRATRWAFGLRTIRGTMPFDILAMHEKFGPVVRIAPDELAFTDPQAWKDIYGKNLPKYMTFYKAWDKQPPSIASATGDVHTTLRRHLAQGFSDRGMREQEPTIVKYVDLLMSRLREKASTGQVQNMTAWYNWSTFDIIGDLTFGEPFDCLEREAYDPWVNMIFEAPKQNVKILSLRLAGLKTLALVAMAIIARPWIAYVKRAREKLSRRIARGVGRSDLLDGLISKKDEDSIDSGTLHFTATFLVLAGAETTATLLSGVTYLLLRNPEALAKVTQEVRSAFTSEKEINMASVGRLSYMQACLSEAMRRYPPIPIGLPRVVPKGGAAIAGHFVPENSIVSIYQYAASNLSSNWTAPFEYRPGRFLGDKSFADDRIDASQPFLTGPRNCIGRNLGFAEMRLILARLLYSFDMKLAEDSKGWLDDQKIYLFWRKNALNVHLTPRVLA